jgi:hypothetical protein
VLAPGERGTLPLIACNRRQARTLIGYVNGVLAACPMLAATVANRTAESVELTNGIIIEVHTASFRSIRGYTVIGAVCDEIAYWWSDDDSANPDKEIIAALRPAMATVPGALLIGISSPYARKGVLWDMHRRYYGQDGDVLVWQAATRVMNPTVPQHVIDDALAEDPSAAAAEYRAEFRRDLEAYIPAEVIDRAVAGQPAERPPVPGVAYGAFTDPSGGSADSFTLAIAHVEHGRLIVDLVRETRPPFSPESVVAEYAAVLRRYRVTAVYGDHYAGVWPAEQFAKHGITYRVARIPKSELYLRVLPWLMSDRVRLVDVPRLRHQFSALDRRTSRAGRDTVDHVPGGKDDVCNACAGSLVVADWQAGQGDRYRRPRGIRRPTGIRRPHSLRRA